MWDTAEFQAVGAVLGIAHPTGYPTYTLLAWLASAVLQPFGNEALRANLLSALLVAGGSALAAWIVAQLTRRAIAGAAAGAALAVTTVAWSVGVRADPHALHLLMVALLLLLLVGWGERWRADPAGKSGDGWLLAAAVVFGVSLGNHALTALLAPGIAVYVLAIAPRLPLDRPRLVAACTVALIGVTVALYAYLPIRAAMEPPLNYGDPQNWENFRYVVFGEQFRGSFGEFPSLGAAFEQVVQRTVGELGLIAGLALVGLVAAWRRWPALVALLAFWFGLTWLFALGYDNADIERYHLGPTLAVAVLGGLGGAALWDLAERAWLHASSRLAGWRPRAGGLLLAALATVVLLGPTLALVPQRFDDLDDSDYTFGRDWLEEVLAVLEPDAVVVSWWSFSTPLWYAQYVEGRRADVWVVDDRTRLDEDLGSPEDVIDRHLGERPVYLIRLSRDLPNFEDRYRLRPVTSDGAGQVFLVEGRH